MAEENEDPTAQGDPATGQQPPDPAAPDVDPVSDAETWLVSQPKEVQDAFNAKNGNLLKAIKAERDEKRNDRGAAKKLKELEAQLAEKAKAEMSEVDRLKLENAEKAKALAEKEKLIATHTAEKAFDSAVAKLKIVFANEKAKEDAFARMDIAAPEGFEKAIKSLVSERPYLLKTVETPDLDAEDKGKKNKGVLTPEKQAELERRFRLK